jgi:hypothetical protein
MRLMLLRGLGVAARSGLGSPGFHISCFGFGPELRCVRLYVLLPIGAFDCPRTSSARRPKAAEDYSNEPVPQRSVISPKAFESIDLLEPEIKFASIF